MTLASYAVTVVTIVAMLLIVAFAIPPLLTAWYRLMHIKPFNIVVQKYYDWVDYWVENSFD